MIGRFRGIIEPETYKKQIEKCEEQLASIENKIEDAVKEAKKLRRYIEWLKNRILREGLK